MAPLPNSLHELRDGFRHAIDVSPAAADNAVKRVGMLVRGVRAGEYPVRPERRKCTRCHFRRICGSADCNPMDLM
ncbi:MAG: PD-(D/E)XK nuclease family protein [Phycisphaeraceae bacterium]|nr:PD-(D/E)XK nuclease family protein [Phycisphaeraceae bacterium]